MTVKSFSSSLTLLLLTASWICTFQHTSATYAGLFTVASYIICPCLLQIFSSRIIKQAGLTSKTQYTTIFSNELTAWTVACLGTAMIFYAIIGSAVIEV